MTLRSNLWPALLGALALAAPAARAADNPSAHRDCFLSNDWHGWSAPGDGDVIYLRVRINDIWRAELTPGIHVRKYPDEFLVNRVRGSSYICSPLDLDLTLSDRHGMRRGLIVRSLRKLTPQEIAAIPKKDLP